MAKQILFVMDDIASINPKKDTTLAMMLEAQNRGYQCFSAQINDLTMQNEIAGSYARLTTVRDTTKDFYTLENNQHKALSDFSVILMRKDPPVNNGYLYAAMVLAIAKQQGVLVLNSPEALCQFNEKIFIHHFKELIAPSLLSAKKDLIMEFLKQHKHITLKPVDGMGGKSIFSLQYADLNTNSIIDTLSNNGQNLIVAQKYIPEIKSGDKRVLIVGYSVMPYMLKRIPNASDFRGNLAAGASAVVAKTTDKEIRIAEKIIPILKKHNLSFVGIDIIGDYLTEINITSPTCVREIEAETDLNICGEYFTYIENTLQQK